MSNKKKTSKPVGCSSIIMEDKGLAPASSGTPMPKVKPAAKQTTTKSQSNKKS